MRRTRFVRGGVCPAIAACLLAAPALAQDVRGTAAIWHDRGGF
jgi:hypothetical protein